MNLIGLWAGDNYYPSQSLGDFVGFYETVDDAKAAKPDRCDWAEIYELVLQEVPEWQHQAYWPTYEADRHRTVTYEWHDLR
jgi:hypothetical protein